MQEPKETTVYQLFHDWQVPTETAVEIAKIKGIHNIVRMEDRIQVFYGEAGWKFTEYELNQLKPVIK